MLCPAAWSASMIVTACYYDDDGNGGYTPVSFAIESPNRSHGIRVISKSVVKVGDDVTITGAQSTENGEPVIQATSVIVNSSDNTVPSPLGMSNLVSGSSIGLNNMGILTRLWGKVTESVDTGNYSGYFYIDDGSHCDDGSGIIGIKCRPAASAIGKSPDPLPAKGDFVYLTGIMGAQANSPYFWTQSITTACSDANSTTMIPWREFQFGTSTDAWGFSHLFTTDMTGIASPAADTEYSVSTTDTSTCITVTGVGKTWGGYCDVGSIGSFQGQMRFYGGETINLTYSFKSSGRSLTAIYLQYNTGERITIANGSTLIGDGLTHTLSFAMPSSSIGKTLSSLVVNLQNPRLGSTTLCLMDFEIIRDPSISTRIDADTILATPPVHNARVGMVNGAMAMIVDGMPISGLGWTCIINQNVSDQTISDMVSGTGFKCARLVFTLGESCIKPAFYPPTWLGPNLFDWTYLDQQMGRILTANPQTKVILLVDLDGALWWTKLHPDAAGMQANIGIPDYLSPEWERDSRDAIRQMVAHIQSSSYAGAVIGYELFNGSTLDCGFEVNDSTPRALARFRATLQSKYGTVAALQAAWGDPTVTFDNATPEPFFTAAHPYDLYNDLWSFLPEPSARPRYQDSVAFRNHVYQRVILDFARNIKEATQGRAIVGARTGTFMGDLTWKWDYGYQEMFPINELLASSDFDVFEVQESYYGRTDDGLTGSGVPETIPQGLAAHNKLIVIQNDWRTHTGPDFSSGATANMAQTVQVQRRVLANSLVLGMSPYLWQMSWYYNIGDKLPDGTYPRDLTLVNEFKKMDDISRKSLYTDRSSGAKVAFVFDVNYKKYFGYNSDPYYHTPSKGGALFDSLKTTWARAGVPFDMIFLDDLNTSMPYKVYVFVHTVGITDTQMNLINSVVKRNGNVAIFLWADGLTDGWRRNPARMSTLTGMNIQMLNTSRRWEMTPTSWAITNLGVNSGYLMGTLNNYYGGVSSGMPFYPTFTVNDAAANSIALYKNTTDVGIAKKSFANWTSIYAGTANIVPALLRYAVDLAGVHRYTSTEDICYISNSFIGLHPQTTGNITVTLPSSSALYDLFNDLELPAGTSFSIPVTQGSTYLYYRGTKAQWQALGQ